MFESRYRTLQMNAKGIKMIFERIKAVYLKNLHTKYFQNLKRRALLTSREKKDYDAITRPVFYFIFSNLWLIYNVLSFYFFIFFNSYFPNTTFFSYSTACWPSYTYMYTFCFHTLSCSITWLDIAPSATQQDIIANPFQNQ